MAKKDFEDLFLEAIDETFASLGESVRQAIYFHLEKKFKVTKKDIPNHLEQFASGLEKIFGLGARFLEILIMKKLYEKIDQPLAWSEDKELVFAEYVAAARNSYSHKSRETNQIKA